MEQRRGLERLDLALAAQSQATAELDGLRLHATDMAVRHLVLRVDRHRQALDGREVQSIELGEVPIRIFTPPDAAAEGGIEEHDQRDDRAEAAPRGLARLECDEQRHRCAGEITERHADKVRAPDL